MTATRISFALAALLGLTACASTVAPPMEIAPPEPVPEATAPALVPMLPDDLSLAMEYCRVLTIENEIVDFTRADAKPTFETRMLVAEAPRTEAEKGRGMQHRFDPHPRSAMVFEFEGDHNPALWMSQTPASLDMIFIAAEGAAFYVEASTTPYSEQFLTPEEPDPVATHVLEVPAGGADMLGITPGFTRIEVGPPRPCNAFFALS